MGYNPSQSLKNPMKTLKIPLKLYKTLWTPYKSLFKKNTLNPSKVPARWPTSSDGSKSNLLVVPAPASRICGGELGLLVKIDQAIYLLEGISLSLEVIFLLIVLLDVIYLLANLRTRKLCLVVCFLNLNLWLIIITFMVSKMQYSHYHLSSIATNVYAFGSTGQYQRSINH